VTCGAILGLVVVGVDGSDGSRRALEWASSLAAATSTPVLAVHVLTYNQELVRDVSLDTMRTWRRELERELRSRWAQPLTDHGIDKRCLVVEADSVAQGLLDVADREGASLLVVGATGHGGVASRVLGGVTYRVTHRARQPVVVVPPDRS
jgi:nucleotide-binding universal stress UspA family protein